MTRIELQKELEKTKKNFVKAKDKILCFPYTLKWKGKNFTVLKEKKILFSTKDENEACEQFLSCVRNNR